VTGRKGKSLGFREFASNSYPEASVFDRPDFDFATNLVKWFAIRVGFVLYKAGISANALDALGIVLTLSGYFLMLGARDGVLLWPAVGVLILYSHIFLDFFDGAIAKASGVTSALGHELDNVGLDIDRLAMFVLLGVFTENAYVVLANSFAAFILIVLMPATQQWISPTEISGAVLRIYTNRYSVCGCRFILVLLPLGVLVATASGLGVVAYGQAASLVYVGLAGLWLMLCALGSEPDPASTTDSRT
jgi:phosphatidylglycerophosphate synthase